MASIKYVNYHTEDQLPHIINLVKKYLSEPYSVYTYRYFTNNWGKLSFLAYDGDDCVGAIICKMDARDAQMSYKGYIAMLVVKQEYRKMSIGSQLVKLAINAMIEAGADEVALETEVTNKPALKLYQNLGFLRDKRFFRYYLNGLDAIRLKLWIKKPKQL